MSISLGLYDLFSNIIPGSLYLFFFYLVLYRIGNIDFDFSLLSLWSLILLGILAYVTGLVLDPLARFWYKRFYTRSQSEIISDLNESNDSIQFEEGKMNWAFLSYKILHDSPDIHHSLHRLGAIYILLRNVSFIFLLISLFSIVDIFISGFVFWQLVLSFSSLVFSILVLKNAIKFDRMRYKGTYLAIAAIHADDDKLPAKVINRRKKSSQDYDKD
jgi:hypothetical protein